MTNNVLCKVLSSQALLFAFIVFFIVPVEQAAVLESDSLGVFLSDLMQNLLHPISNKASAVKARSQLLSYAAFLCQCPAFANMFLSLGAIETLIPQIKKQPQLDL